MGVPSPWVLPTANNELPFPKVSAPTRRHSDIAEHMGFSYCLPCTDEVSNPTETTEDSPTYVIVDDDEQQAEDAEETTGPDSQLAKDFGDDFDVEVLLTETGFLEATSEANEREIGEEIRRTGLPTKQTS
jgi:hypothetical protein